MIVLKWRGLMEQLPQEETKRVHVAALVVRTALLGLGSQVAGGAGGACMLWGLPPHGSAVHRCSGRACDSIRDSLRDSKVRNLGMERLVEEHVLLAVGLEAEIGE